MIQLNTFQAQYQRLFKPKSRAEAQDLGPSQRARAQDLGLSQEQEPKIQAQIGVKKPEAKYGTSSTSDQ